jgi:NMD protein affecting ribosome stability and mRNA decay
VRIETCVRCGRAGRYLESWLCVTCYKDPNRLIEQRAVESAAWSDYRAMRRMLRDEFGWIGGWGRKETEGA